MNNEQLAILLKMYHFLLVEALDKIKDSLPETLRTQRENLLGIKYFVYPVLFELETLTQILNDAIELLKKRD